jgi:hypothetical protein
MNNEKIYKEIEKVYFEFKSNSSTNEKLEILIFNCILASLERLELSYIFINSEFLIYQKKIAYFISNSLELSIDILNATVQFFGC